jgi:hypothetical protein
MPQCWLLFCVSVQTGAPPSTAQGMNPGPQLCAHLPIAQISPPWHVVPHPPQLVLSLDGSTQPPSHITAPPPQERTHCPLRQISPAFALHDLPHDPQFEGSLSRLAHDVPHVVKPAGQATGIDVSGCIAPASSFVPASVLQPAIARSAAQARAQQENKIKPKRMAGTMGRSRACRASLS